jgi:hypothetical protein
MIHDVFSRVCLGAALATYEQICGRRSALTGSITCVPPPTAFPWKMHLVFSTSDYTNSDISDQQGHILYSVSTPRASKRITTITKYRWSGPNSVSETMATVEWHELKDTLIRFNGNEIKADTMLWKRRWNTYVWSLRRIRFTDRRGTDKWALFRRTRSTFLQMETRINALLGMLIVISTLLRFPRVIRTLID